LSEVELVRDLVAHIFDARFENIQKIE
jgi:hypothetical protein